MDLRASPSDWEFTSLEKICSFITKGATPTTYGFKWERSGILFLRSECVSENGLDLSESMFISTKAHATLRRSEIKDGDVLMTITGYVGRVIYVSGVGEANINQHVARIRIISNAADGHYVFHVLSQSKFRTYYSSITTGQAYPQISLRQVRDTEIPLPPIEEQRAIATALSDVDALIDALDKLIAKKRDLKQAAMQQLLTGQTRLPGFTDEWSAKRFGELFNFSGGLSASRDQLSDNGHCYLHYGDIHLSDRTYIDVEADFLSIPKLSIGLSNVNNSALLRDGDIVFVDASEDDAGTSKHWVVVNKDNRPYISGLHTIVAKPKAGDLENDFKRYCFQTKHIRDQFRFYAVGTKVSGISKTSIAKIELRYPKSAEEQQAIAAILCDMDAELVALEARRDKTRALKQGMMQELLTGRIRLM